MACSSRRNSSRIATRRPALISSATRNIGLMIRPCPWSAARRSALALLLCSGAQLLLDALVEARDIDDDALVRAVPNRLLLVVGLDLEYERAAIDPDQFGRRVDAHSDRRGGEMADIEMDAETLMTVWEQLLDGRERRCLTQIDHDGSGEHGHSLAADAGGCMFGADQQICRSLHSDLQMRQFDHRELPKRDPRRGHGDGHIVPDAVWEFNRWGWSRRRPDERQRRFQVLDLAQ